MANRGKIGKQSLSPLSPSIPNYQLNVSKCRICDSQPHQDDGFEGQRGESPESRKQNTLHCAVTHTNSLAVHSSLWHVISTSSRVVNPLSALWTPSSSRVLMPRSLDCRRM